MKAIATAIAILIPTNVVAAEDGARRIKFLNYEDCIELSNQDTVVVLGHHVGGRVLKYARNGKDSLYLSPSEATWGTPDAPTRPPSSVGRFDIGPELLIPRRDVLWSGQWSAEISGPRAARLTSEKDNATGVQLIREFELAADSTHLRCTQIIKNVSAETKRWNHWSRTFAKHGGIVVVPLTPQLSKFPVGWVMYEKGHLINFRPEDPAVRQRNSCLEVLKPTRFPKLGMDSFAGWFAYQMPNDLLFVKTYKADPKRVYSEAAGITISIWYPDRSRIPACELEPIGPREEIAPGRSASFTENWWLLANEFPAAGDDLDIKRLTKKVRDATGSG